MLKKNKFFFFLNLKSILLNNKYIIFSNTKLVDNKKLNTLKININKVNCIFYENRIDFTNNCCYIFVSNKINIFNELKNIKLFALSYNGFFINNNYLCKLNNYKFFFTYNYKLYILLVYNFILKFIMLIYIINFKILVSFLIN